MDENVIHFVTFHHIEWIYGTSISIVGISWKIMPSHQLAIFSQAIVRLIVLPITSQTLEDNVCASGIKQDMCTFIPSLFCALNITFGDKEDCCHFYITITQQLNNN